MSEGIDAQTLEALSRAAAHARGREAADDWDREVAKVAARRWASAGRRKHGSTTEARTADLAKGLLERFDPERLDEPGWHQWTAQALAAVLLVDALDASTTRPAARNIRGSAEPREETP